MNGIQNAYQSIEQISSQLMQKNGRSNEKQEEIREGTSFQDVLQLHFSKHAASRLNERSMDMSQEQMKRLQNGMNMAREKGLKDSLVMVDNMAFIVNLKSNTVVTAVNSVNRAVFTNIDGAVIS